MPIRAMRMSATVADMAAMPLWRHSDRTMTKMPIKIERISEMPHMIRQAAPIVSGWENGYGGGEHHKSAGGEGDRNAG